MPKETSKTTRKVKKVADLPVRAAKASKAKGGINYRETDASAAKPVTRVYQKIQGT
jgi:hypothetical protein